jgi:hypothetical protein
VRQALHEADTHTNGTSRTVGFQRTTRAEQLLPFRVRIVRNEEQLGKAVRIRAEAYERHWPNLYLQLQSPEDQDRNPNSLIFLAESKNDGSAVGTMRVDTNLVTPLPITDAIELPNKIQRRPVAYVTRLGVKQGFQGSLVKLALFKTLHRYCLAKQLYWMLVGIRPPGDKDYVRLGFVDVYEEQQLVPIFSSGGVPVRLMAFEVISAERRWHETHHPLFKFMFDDYHPDIEVFSSVNGMWSQPRKSLHRFTDHVNIFDELGIPLI